MNKYKSNICYKNNKFKIHVDQSFLFLFVTKLQGYRIFQQILNKFESGSDGAVGRAVALRVGVQIRAKTDTSLHKMRYLRSTNRYEYHWTSEITFKTYVPCFSSCDLPEEA